MTKREEIEWENYILKLEADRFNRSSEMNNLIKTKKERLYKEKIGKLLCPLCGKASDFWEYLTRKDGYLCGYECTLCKGSFHQSDAGAVPMYNRYVYESKCEKCGKEYMVIDQADNMPEYRTSVYVVCDCGSLVSFALPVN